MDTKNVVSANYNAIAKRYNSITQLISLNGNLRSQQYFLKFIDHSSTVLHIGCGSIDFNTLLAASPGKITAIDISQKMINIAEDKVKNKGLHTNFICQDIMEYEPEEKFDIVFANFFLNTFEWNDCKKVIKKITTLVKPGGLICVADEALPKKRSTKITVTIFRPFFTFLHHIWVKHPMHKVYDYESSFASNHCIKVEAHRDQSDYIVSTVYKLNTV